MSDDIVETLRDKAFRRCGPTMEAVHTKHLEWIAADEIERLRDAIMKAQKALHMFYAAEDSSYISDAQTALDAVVGEYNFIEDRDDE
jgi:hypothetical protein